MDSVVMNWYQLQNVAKKVSKSNYRIYHFIVKSYLAMVIFRMGNPQKCPEIVPNLTPQITCTEVQAVQASCSK